MNPELAKKILDAIASGDEKKQAALLQEIAASLIGGDTSETPPADPASATADPPQPNPDEPAAAASKALDEANARIAKLEEAAGQRDATERAVLVAELVKLGVETPATAWLRDKAGKVTTTPVARLVNEPVAEMRERVAVLAKAAPKRPEPPERSESSDDEFSPAVKEQIAKMTTAQRATFDRMRAARDGGTKK